MEWLIRFAADGLVVIITLLALYAFATKIPRSQWRFWAPRIVLAGVTAYLVAKLAGAVFQPETLRPFEKLGVPAGAAYLPNPGFPSDHALFATFLTLAVWYSTKNKPLTLTLAVLTIIMGVARVLALVHTPLDIIGGIIIAFAGVGWYYVGKLDEKSKK